MNKLFWLTLLALSSALALSGCGADANGAANTIIMQTAPDGTQCYVLYSDGKAVGLACK